MGVEPTMQKFLDQVAQSGTPSIHSLSPQDARVALTSTQSVPVVKAAADIDDRTVPDGPTGDVRIRIVRPKGDRSTLPVVMFFHGGGWVLGDCDSHDRMVRKFATGANAAVVFVDYDRAPEARYPVAIEQAYAATRYVAEHAREFNVDTERRGPRIGFQVMFYPVTDANFDTDSYRLFENGPWLTRDTMQWFWDDYLPDRARRAEPTASPLQATLAQLKGLPPALLITDENDALRDEGEAYAQKLVQAGVSVTAMRYLGTIDVATASLIEVWIDEAEKRTWFLFETGRRGRVMRSRDRYDRLKI